MSASHELLIEKLKTLNLRLLVAPVNELPALTEEIKQLNVQLERSTSLLSESKVIKG